jgi:hypothetical protein
MEHLQTDLAYAEAYTPTPSQAAGLRQSTYHKQALMRLTLPRTDLIAVVGG